MTNPGKLIAGVIVGAGVVYLMDPEQGPRRRALLQERGAQLRSRLRLERSEDQVLSDLVRSAIERGATYPGAIRLIVSQGRVTLTGDVLLDEVNELIDRVERVRGVDEVRNELALHRTAEGVPELQRAGPPQDRAGPRGAWTPTTRLVLGATGGVLALQGVRRNSVSGRALTFLGSGLLARAASPVPPQRATEKSAETELLTESVTPTALEPAPVAKSTTKRRRSRR